MQYTKGPPSWSPDQPNPLSPDGSYLPGWSCLSLRGTDDANYFTGRTKAGCWLLRLGRKVDDLNQRIIDYIRYENTWGRTVILEAPEHTDPDGLIATALEHALPPDGLRPSDPRYIVHSTTMESWRLIQETGQLRAASLTARRDYVNTSSTPNDIDRYLLEEPPEYKEYIMFGVPRSPAPERIIASYQLGRSVFDDDVPYQPGVRVYLDNRKLIEDGLPTRDGIHTIKVHLTLPLSPYTVSVVKLDDLAIPKGSSFWTPRTFTAEADNRFSNEIRGSV